MRDLEAHTRILFADFASILMWKGTASRQRERMSQHQFPIQLDNDMTRVATLAIFAGSAMVGMAGWTVVGWLVVVLGLSMLWLAYHVAVAPDEEELRL
jgi:1,4-dihydroxy-2-naphthoate octaprenyltransferase